MTDKTFFLHHYEASPYAEKIRLMLGAAGQRWGSVLVAPYPPRPEVDTLAGGYRRIPIANLGADVFCDTALIAAEVAALTGSPLLAPAIADPAALALAARAEGDVFFSAITSASPLKLLGKLLATNGPVGTFKFVRDRSAMMKGASVKPPQGAAAARLFEGYLADLEQHLSDRAWLDGDQPAYADFCAYHPIWLALSVGSVATLGRYTYLAQWLDRMASLGHGLREEAAPEQVFAETRACTPRALPDSGMSHEALGSPVSIAPVDYGRQGVTGTLVAVSADRFILARTSDQLGTLHVHFPRDGYELAF